MHAHLRAGLDLPGELPRERDVSDELQRPRHALHAWLHQQRDVQRNVQADRDLPAQLLAPMQRRLRRRRRLPVKRACVLVAGLAFAMALGATAHAEPDAAGAKAAYDRGLEAHRRGELHRAAEEFALADALSPSAVALQAAIDAAIGADDPALGQELIERSRREPVAPPLASSVTAAHLKFGGRAGRLRVTCPTPGACTAKVDDRTVTMEKPIWIAAGTHTVSVQLEGTTQTKPVEVPADQAIEVAPTPRSAGAPTLVTRSVTPDALAVEIAVQKEEQQPSHQRGRKLPPIVFYTGVGLTVILVATSAYFAADTGDQHDAFKSTGCLRANYTNCVDLKTKGENSQTATNVAAVLAGASAIATIVVGVAFTSWNGPVVAAYPGGAAAGWRTSF
jgi:hypothetical protein